MRLPAWWLLPVCALLGAALGGAYGMLRTAQYTATSYVMAVADDKSDPTTALGFAQAYGRVATQLAVLGDAQIALGVPVDTLRASVRTATSPDAPMVAVSATAAHPADAAAMANAVSQALTTNANQTRKQTGVRLLLFSRAAAPTSPATSSPVVTALVGSCAGGLLAGLGLLVRPRPKSAGARAGTETAGAGTAGAGTAGAGTAGSEATQVMEATGAAGATREQAQARALPLPHAHAPAEAQAHGQTRVPEWSGLAEAGPATATASGHAPGTASVPSPSAPARTSEGDLEPVAHGSGRAVNGASAGGDVRARA